MIQIHDLNYTINGKEILQNIELKIADGEFVAIIGPNGAGKSTLIKLLLGLLDVQSGSISIDGTDHLAWLKDNSIGYLPQREEFDRQFPATALEITLLGLIGDLGLFHRVKAIHRKQALAALEETGIGHLANKLIGRLSGGEFQRVLLARALVTRSKYLILDEPEAGIDRVGVEGFFSLLKKLNNAGRTIITISHDLHTLTEYCSFLVCLNRQLHCHTATELLSSEVIHKTFGDNVRLIEKGY